MRGSLNLRWYYINIFSLFNGWPNVAYFVLLFKQKLIHNFLSWNLCLGSRSNNALWNSLLNISYSLILIMKKIFNCIRLRRFYRRAGLLHFIHWLNQLKRNSWLNVCQFLTFLIEEISKSLMIRYFTNRRLYAIWCIYYS